MDLFPVSNTSLLLVSGGVFLITILLAIAFFAPFFPHSANCVECLSITIFEFRQLASAEKDNRRENLCCVKMTRIVAVI